MFLKRQQTNIQNRRLHESRQAGGNDLPHPVCEPVCKTSRNRKQIQASDRSLAQQNASSLDVRQNYFHNTIAEQQNKQQAAYCSFAV